MTAPVAEHTAVAAPRASRLRLTVAVVGFAVVAAVVLAATLSPTPLDQGYESAIAKVLDVLHRYGVPNWFGYRALEFSANMAMFLPPGFLVALALPARAIWLFLLLIPAMSGTIELMQATFLAERFASVSDVVANTLGGYAGALMAVVLRAAVRRRDEKLVTRALWDAGYSA